MTNGVCWVVGHLGHKLRSDQPWLGGLEEGVRLLKGLNDSTLSIEIWESNHPKLWRACSSSFSSLTSPHSLYPSISISTTSMIRGSEDYSHACECCVTQLPCHAHEWIQQKHNAFVWWLTLRDQCTVHSLLHSIPHRASQDPRYNEGDPDLDPQTGKTPRKTRHLQRSFWESVPPLSCCAEYPFSQVHRFSWFKLSRRSLKKLSFLLLHCIQINYINNLNYSTK